MNIASPPALPRVFSIDLDLRRAPGVSVSTPRGQVVIPKRDNTNAEWPFFADDDPNANWEHPCRYLFVYEDRAIVEVPQTLPPVVDDNAAILEIYPFGTNHPTATFPPA